MDEHAYSAYGEIWSYNLQRLDELQEELTRRLKDLEERYRGFDSCYAGIHSIMEVICSLYASNNTLEGKKEVLALMSVIESYRGRYTGSGFDFKLISDLLSKIESLRESSYEDFPILHHEIDSVFEDSVPSDTPIVSTDVPAGGLDPSSVSSNRPYRWITFQRNGSYFITRYATVDVISFSTVTAEDTGIKNRIMIRAGDTSYEAIDCMAVPGRTPEEVNCCVIVDGLMTYAAYSIGKKIFAKKNFISPLVRPFKTVGESMLYAGRVRLFGKNHIVLRNQNVDSAIMSCPGA